MVWIYVYVFVITMSDSDIIVITMSDSDIIVITMSYSDIIVITMSYSDIIFMTMKPLTSFVRYRQWTVAPCLELMSAMYTVHMLICATNGHMCARVYTCR
jgi:hypothetical protein